jgi:ABC-2 type transport system permease protein
MIPQHVERDVLAGRRPEVVFFYNTQMLTIGNLVLRGINGAIPSVAAGVRISLRNAEGQPTAAAQAALAPIPVQTHPLFNPTLNYVHFLLAALLPAILQIVVVTSTAYSVGLDAGTRHRLRILGRLGGGVWPAMAGKLVPYTLIYLAVLAVSDVVLFGFLEMPLRGHRELLVLAALLFILACQLIGSLLALVLRPMAKAISIGTLLMSPAFGYMGIGFPRLSMNAFAYGWGEMLPGTWYLMVRIDQTIRGTPPDLSWPPILMLLAFVIGLSILTVMRLLALRRRAAAERTAPAVQGAAS